MAFTHTLTARFYEVDRAGIVFFGRFFEYCHTALEELLAKLLGQADACFREGWGMPLVHTSSDFSAPVHMGDRVSIELSVEAWSKRSLSLAYVLKVGDVVHARCKTVHAFVNLGTFKPMAMPEHLKAALVAEGLIEADG